MIAGNIKQEAYEQIVDEIKKIEESREKTKQTNKTTIYINSKIISQICF